ncbi:UNVERIFIED_CONTAM: hypothetical protein FKN15_024484 [Acipenser sinensis]
MDHSAMERESRLQPCQRLSPHQHYTTHLRQPNDGIYERERERERERRRERGGRESERARGGRERGRERESESERARGSERESESESERERGGDDHTVRSINLCAEKDRSE